MILGFVAAAAVQWAVSQVTVFSDRARVVRTTHAAAGKVELPLLPDSVDPDSIRVAAAGAEVQRIDVAHVEPDAFPADEARALLVKLEKVDDRIALAAAERDDDARSLDELRRISPQLPPIRSSRGRG